MSYNSSDMKLESGSFREFATTPHRHPLLVSSILLDENSKRTMNGSQNAIVDALNRSLSAMSPPRFSGLISPGLCLLAESSRRCNASAALRLLRHCWSRVHSKCLVQLWKFPAPISQENFSQSYGTSAEYA